MGTACEEEGGNNMEVVKKKGRQMRGLAGRERGNKDGVDAGKGTVIWDPGGRMQKKERCMKKGESE